MNAQHAPPRSTFVCTNAQGLTPLKLFEHISWLRETRVDMAVLTEVRSTSSPEDLLQHLPGAGAIWPGARFFFCPGTGHTEGIILILSPHCPITDPVLRPILGPTGRILGIDAFIGDSVITILCVYAPAQAADREDFFFNCVRPNLPTDGRLLLVVGDFNCILDPLDAVYPPHRLNIDPMSRMQGAPPLADIMNTYSLQDIWRNTHPTAKDFTHWSIPASSGGRLDRWLASDSLLALFTATSSILPTSGFISDHRPVSITLSFLGHAPPKGQGLQGFPLLLLNIPEACDELKNIIASQSLLLNLLPDSDIVTKWDNMKEVIRTSSWAIYKKHRRARQRAARLAEDDARQEFSQVHFSPDAISFLARLNIAKAKALAATLAWQQLLAPMLKALPILEHTFGDSSSFYFHHLSRSPHPPVHIKLIQPPGPPQHHPLSVADLSSMIGVNIGLEYARDFYSADSSFGLYRPNPHINQANQDLLLTSLPRPLPPSYAALAEGVNGDGLITSEEMDLAIRSASRGSSPGYDGLPFEVYNAFHEELSPILQRVFNSAFQDQVNSAPLAPLLQGTICLLHKTGQPQDSLAGYRPITLLNCDLKLILLIMAHRLQRPLEYLIDVTQSAFLRGRDISDNIRYHLGLAARLKELGLPGWLLHSDLTKAYDSVNRGWLLKTMSAMGFNSAGITRWCDILMNGSSTRVRLNGFFTTSFPNTSGFPQGGALSCNQWVIIFEPFITYNNQLRSCGTLQSFRLPSGELAPATLSFADDGKHFVLNPATDGPIIKETYVVANSAGLPAQSVPKTRLLLLELPPDIPLPADLDPALGTHHLTGYHLHPPDTPHRLLGVPFGADTALCKAAAYQHMPHSISRAAAPWLSRNLNVIGRAHVAMQCLASKFIFQANFASPPAPLRQQLQSSLNAFVATSSLQEEESPRPGHLFPRFGTAVLPFHRGGLAVPHLASHSAAMLAKTTWLLFSYTGHPWQQLYRHEISRAVRLPPGQASGYHALVTAPSSVDIASITTNLARESAEAFLLLNIRRIIAPPMQCPQSILLETTFNNTPPFPSMPITSNQVLSSQALSWHRLKDIRSAHQQRAHLPPAAVQDLDFILSSLPDPWRDAVLLPELPPPKWKLFPAVAPAGPLAEGPDPLTGEDRLWEVWPSGRLHPLTLPALPPQGHPQAALITLRKKPREAWLRADFEEQLIQQGLPPHQRQELLEPWLVGLWEDLQLDPTTWGLHLHDDTEVNLLELSVRQARQALLHQHIMQQSPSSHHFVPGYTEERAAWPRLWSILPPSTLDTHPSTNPDLRGLRGLESRWIASATERALVVTPIPVPSPEDLPQNAWVDLQRVRPSRPGPAERTAQRQDEPQVSLPLRAGFSQVWVRLADKTLHRPYTITCRSLLHGTLGCNAFLAHVRGRFQRVNQDDPPSIVCSSPDCLQLHTTDTMSHAFLECPDSAPVIDWLLSTWETLTGGQRLPRCPFFLLGDDITLWPGTPPPPSTLRLWSFLRITTLGAIWQVRSSRADRLDHSEPLHHKAICLALGHLHQAIARDWMRTQTDLRHLDNGAFCQDWWRGLDCSLTVASFASLWATPPIFCTMIGVTPGDQEPDTRTMEMTIPMAPALPTIPDPIPDPAQALVLDPDLDPAPDPAHYPDLDLALDPDPDPAHSRALDPDLDPDLGPAQAPALGPDLDPDLDPAQAQDQDPAPDQDQVPDLDTAHDNISDLDLDLDRDQSPDLR